jgi:hypothetical protein
MTRTFSKIGLVILFSLFGIFFFNPTAAHAALITSGTVYVDSDLGTNNGTCGASTGAAACKTLSYATGSRLGTFTGPVTVNCVGATAETASLSLFQATYTTTATNYLEIVGNWTGGVYDATKFHLSLSNTPGLVIRADYVRVHGLQIVKTSSSADSQVNINVFSQTASANDIRVYNNLLIQAGNASFIEPALTFSSANTIAYVWNNIIYGTSANSTSGSSAISISAGASINIYSNTIISGFNGIKRTAGTVVVKNNYIKSGGSGLALTGTMSSTTNATSDTTGSTGLRSVPYTTDNFTNVTSGSENFTLPQGSLLVGAGTDTSGETAPLNFTTDVKGTTIAAPWSIGANYTAYVVDTTAPTPGSSGTATTSNVYDISLTLNWTKATDDITPQGSLQYRVYQSSSNNISTPTTAVANGTAVNSYTTDINTLAITGLYGSNTYYFTVLVKDSTGNVAAYTTKSVTTHSPCSVTLTDFSAGTNAANATGGLLDSSTYGVSGSNWAITDSGGGNVTFASAAHHALGGFFPTGCTNAWPGDLGSLGMSAYSATSATRSAQFTFPSPVGTTSASIGVWFKTDYPDNASSLNIDILTLRATTLYANMTFAGNGAGLRIGPEIKATNGASCGSSSLTQVGVSSNTWYYLSEQITSVTDGSKKFEEAVYDENFNELVRWNATPCTSETPTYVNIGILPTSGTLFGYHLYFDKLATCFRGTCPFPLMPIRASTLLTPSFSSIGATSVVASSTITFTGGEDVSASGFAYGTSATLATVIATTTLGAQSGTAQFSQTISSLTCGTTYYVRPYTVNTAGTSTAAIASFTTSSCGSAPTVTTSAASSITALTAILNGSISVTGGADATQSGFAYGTNSTLATVIATTTLGAQTGTASFISSASSLTCNTVYYFRAYATNTSGTGYGSIQSFTTSACSPTVTIQTASSIGLTSATANGNITATGGATPTVRGFAYGLTTAYSFGTTTESGSFSTGAFTASLSPLLCSTTYHVRAYAINSAGTSFSGDQSFTTTSCARPTVSSSAATSLTPTTAILNGSITDDGSISITDSGFALGSNSTLTSGVATTSLGAQSGSVPITLTNSSSGLTCGNTYYFRPYAANSSGTSFGTITSLTPPCLAAVSAVSSTVTSIGATITWTSDQISSSKVQFGQDTTYGSTTPERDTSPRVTSHSLSLTNLLSCTTYHYRVRSKDGSNTEVVGTDNSLTTTGCTGSASVLDSSASTITVASGGSVNLLSAGKGITLTVPTSYTTATSSSTFQVKQLDKSAYFSSISLPTGFTNVGSYLYNLKSVSDATTTISTFAQPLTVSIAYTDADVTDIDTSTLTIKRWDGVAWNSLTSCTTDTSLKTVTCSTTGFSDFALFGQAVTPSQSPAPATPSSSSSQVSTGSSGSASPSFLCKYLGWYCGQTKPTVIIPATPAPAPTHSAPTLSFTRDLETGMTGNDVRELQKYLNAHGYIVNKNGLGSPGSETDFFGSLTKQALMKLQKDNKLPSTGYFGPLTRKLLSS